MSIRIGTDETPGTGARPVFVDDSGRRRAWLRVAGRAAVVLLAVYAALVAIGLTGNLSFPVVHLGAAGRPPVHLRRTALPDAGHRSASRAAPALSLSGRGVPPADEQLTGAPHDGTVQPRAVMVAAPGQTTPSSGAIVSVQSGVSQTITTTTVAAPPTTVAPGSGNTHGQLTRHGHGPPTSAPGKGKGP
jgi:hypothetical protein